ncbi:MAG: hypothetical protein PVH73_05270 [Candidatus Bathyarchaeota archaeon]
MFSSTSLCVVQVAGETSKPSVPEFTLKFVDDSYDVPPTYSIDPFTGENVTKDGYRVEKYSIEVRIKNQPFTSVYDKNGTLIVGLYYNLRFKGHYTDEWDYYPYDPDNGHKTLSYSPTYHASQSDYTIIFLRPNIDTSGGIRLDVPIGGEVDFQMQTLTGNVTKVYTGMMGLWSVGGEMDHYYVFTGETSDWSSTQTFTYEQNSQTTTDESTIPEFPAWIIIQFFLIATLSAIIFRKRLFHQHS